MIDAFGVLTAKQADVARGFLAARAAERHHLVIYLSGAHAYGFPSPDSDLDLKCVHVAPTHDLVGLDLVTESRDRLEIIDGARDWPPRSRPSTRPWPIRRCRWSHPPPRSMRSTRGCATSASGSGDYAGATPAST